ncbi:MAG TPA: cation transporter [Acidobacteriaceae bacterium]|nr:cation transporter [Acidobacteriaceae bacterium]
MDKIPSRTLWLQSFTLLWMTLEVSVAAFSAASSHSPALLAFGSDSLVELLSAVVVLLPWLTKSSIPERLSGRLTGILLFVLALVVVLTAALSLALRRPPEPSRPGIAITLAALLVMPALAALKRREAHNTGNIALSADAIQSATCAWIALLALLGLAVNALFHIPWFDSVAAVAIVPLLIREGRAAIKGETCGCI